MTSKVEHVLVRTAPSGEPLVVERGGHQWLVAEEPLRWFERTNWWERERRMPRGQGRIDVEVWRVQARLGRNPRSDLATMELERDLAGGGWRLRPAAYTPCPMHREDPGGESTSVGLK
ncbi:hypothetical protein [Arthrobacter sp. SDTb3-6]|uniref:hypothetical protein n=2 Tax=unclassified Arthrobacter TaxID=235627 RepID=UPI0035237369